MSGMILSSFCVLLKKKGGVSLIIFWDDILLEAELHDFLDGNQWNWCFSYVVASTTFIDAYLMASERRFVDESSQDGSWIIFVKTEKCWKGQKRAIRIAHNFY